MNLELGRAIAAVLKAKRLELVLADRQALRVGLDQAVVVTRRELGPVHTHEATGAVVGVQAERIDTGHVHTERDTHVEGDVGSGAANADVMIGELARVLQRAVAVARLLDCCIGTYCECPDSLDVGPDAVVLPPA
jgi:hypothetical protein